MLGVPRLGIAPHQASLDTPEESKIASFTYSILFVNKRARRREGVRAAIIASLPDRDRHSEKSKDRGCKPGRTSHFILTLFYQCPQTSHSIYPHIRCHCIPLFSFVAILLYNVENMYKNLSTILELLSFCVVSSQRLLVSSALLTRIPLRSTPPTEPAPRPAFRLATNRPRTTLADLNNTSSPNTPMATHLCRSQG